MKVRFTVIPTFPKGFMDVKMHVDDPIRHAFKLHADTFYYTAVAFDDVEALAKQMIEECFRVNR